MKPTLDDPPLFWQDDDKIPLPRGAICLYTITFCNHKGGVGKTFATVATAEMASREWGASILVCDCDGQGNASESLMSEDITGLSAIDICLSDPNKTRFCVHKTRIKNVDLIPSNLKLERPYQSSRSDNDEPAVLLPPAYRVPINGILKVFESLETEYDFCFIDTPPSLGMLTQAAIYASDSVVIPCTLGKHAVFGVPDMMECIHHLKPEITPYIAINAFDGRVRSETLNRSQLLALYEEFVIADISRSTRASENIAEKRYVLSRLDQPYRNQMLSLARNVLALNKNFSAQPIAFR